MSTQSALSDVLMKAFPSLAKDSGTLPYQCWVAKALLHRSSGLDALNSAIEVVDRRGQLPRLLRNLKHAHPTRRTHQDSYDNQVRHHITEACAFAWADLGKLGEPQFDQRPGAPDIHVPPDIWIEAKAVGLGESAQEDMNRALRGNVVTGMLGDATGILRDTNDRRKAFASDFRKAVSQLRGQPTARIRIVFFNLTSISFGQMINDPVPDYVAWLRKLQAGEPDISVVFCKSYEWRSPIRVLMAK